MLEKRYLILNNNILQARNTQKQRTPLPLPCAPSTLKKCSGPQRASEQCPGPKNPTFFPVI